MKKLSALVLFVFLVVLIEGCATQGSPSGGPKDETPPVVVDADPGFFAINFDSDEIEIDFNELVVLKDMRTQLIISPPLETQPIIKPAGTPRKTLSIDLSEVELKDSTTYTFNFGNALQDNNEGNPLMNFRYVFSTGDYIDSLKVGGTVKDAYENEFELGTNLMLFEVDSTYTDSIIFNEVPDYVTKIVSEEDSSYVLENVREGEYLLVALIDANNNLKFDPKTDKIGYHPETIKLPMVDSVGFNMTVYKEIPDFVYRSAGNKEPGLIQFNFEGRDFDKRVERVWPKVNSDTIYQLFSYDENLDTLSYWYTPNKEDSIIFHVYHKDAVIDTAVVPMRRHKEVEYEVTSGVNGTLHMTDSYYVHSNRPFGLIDTTKIEFMDKDSTMLDYEIKIDSTFRKAYFEFDKKEGSSYNFTFYPGAFSSIYKDTLSDTLSVKLRTKAAKDYGTLMLRVNGVKQYPVIVELLTKRGDVARRVHSKQAEDYYFEYLKPGSYGIRLIHDANENGIWDPGHFLKKEQPEAVKYYPGSIELRAFWDMEQEWNLLWD